MKLLNSRKALKKTQIISNYHPRPLPDAKNFLPTKNQPKNWSQIALKMFPQFYRSYFVRFSAR